MNYEKIYNTLVEKAKVRGLDKSQHEGYFEIHHILPRCLGGGDDKSNLVMFTGREHFIAHMLLWKAFPNNDSLASAAFFMRNTRDERNKFSSKLYEKLREQYSSIVSERVSKENSPHYKDLTGLRKHKLTVLGFSHWQPVDSNAHASMWTCQCDCGNVISLKGSSFTIGNTMSCGCARAEGIRKYYFSEKLRRAYYPLKRKYLITGELCDRWSDPEFGIYNFAEDMGEPEDKTLKIGRLDNTKQYSKENCAWLTTSQISARNKSQDRNKSGRVGVRHHIKSNTYSSTIRFEGEIIYLGSAKTFEEAVKLREDAELKYFGWIRQ